MKALFIAIGLGLVVLVAALLVAPSFIDWTQYRTAIAERVEAATGRRLTIEGNVGLSLLPAPTLVAEQLRLDNLPGATAPELASVKALEIRVAFVPLLSGRIEMERVRLIEPALNLEILPDGRRNWDFGVGAEQVPAIELGNVTVRDGRLVWRDGQSGRVERIEKINGRLSAVSLSGPFSTEGELVLRGVPIGFDVSVARWAEGQSVPLSGTIRLGSNAKATLNGAADAKGLSGRLQAEGADFAAALAQFGLPHAAPLAQAFTLRGELQLAADEWGLNDIRLGVGDSVAGGALSGIFAPEPRLDVALQVGRLDLDALLQKAAKPVEKAAADWRIPEDWQGTLSIGVGALTYRQGIVQQAKAEASFADGVLQISRLGALFPGGSDVSLSGTLTLPEGKPHFDGRLTASSDNFRALLAWLKLDPPGVPVDRVRALHVAAALSLQNDVVQVAEIDARLDASRLTGGAAFALRARPSFSIDLLLDRLNIDAYLPRDFAAWAVPAEMLGRFDANVHLRAAQMTWNGMPIERGQIDISLFGGTLTVNRASLGGFAEAYADLNGTVVPGKNWSYELALRSEGSDLERFVRAVAGDWYPSGNLGGFSLNAAIAGDADRTGVSGLQALLGPLTLDGEAAVEWAAARPKVTAKLVASELFGDMFLPLGRGRAEPWSAERIDFGFLQKVDADLQLSGRGLQVHDFDLKEPRLTFKLADGRANYTLHGRLFGAAAEASGSIEHGSAPSFATELSLAEAPLHPVLSALFDIGAFAGKLSAEGAFQTTGASPREIVKALQGELDFRIADGEVAGIDLSRLQQPEASAASALNGGRAHLNSATGRWVVKDGVAEAEAVQAELANADAALSGRVDLVEWKLDLTGMLQPKQPEGAPAAAIRISGPLRHPARAVEAAALQQFIDQRRPPLNPELSPDEAAVRELLQRPAPLPSQ